MISAEDWQQIKNAIAEAFESQITDAIDNAFQLHVQEWHKLEEKKDDVSGFAIDRADMDMLLTKWFDGNYLDITEWKEKTKKWDAHQKIWETDLHISKDRLNELEEKAQKWDDVCSNNHPTKTLLLTERYLEYKDKAQKWDDLQKELKQKSKLS